MNARARFLQQANGLPPTGMGMANVAQNPPQMAPTPFQPGFPRSVVPVPGSDRQSPFADGFQNLGKAGAGFNRYAAGKKTGATPNVGPVADKSPYKEREQNAAMMRNAMLRRLKMRNEGRLFSPENLTGE